MIIYTFKQSMDDKYLLCLIKFDIAVYPQGLDCYVAILINSPPYITEAACVHFSARISRSASLQSDLYH